MATAKWRAALVVRQVVMNAARRYHALAADGLLSDILAGYLIYLFHAA